LPLPIVGGKGNRKPEDTEDHLSGRILGKISQR